MKQSFNASSVELPPKNKKRQRQQQQANRVEIDKLAARLLRPCCRPFAQLSVSGKYFPENENENEKENGEERE